MLVCYSVSKTYVIEKICLFVIPSKIYVTLSSKTMFFCLTQKPHPVRRPPLCRRGAGGEAIPRERENQINTLVLKDINFTINIIELSYYRTIDILNQSNKCSRGIKRKPPKRKPPQAPTKEGMSITLLTGFHSFQTISNKDIPSKRGLGRLSFLTCYWSSLLFILLFRLSLLLLFLFLIFLPLFPVDRI